MTSRSASLMLCGVLVACVAPPREPVRPTEQRARWEAQVASADRRADEVMHSVAIGGAGGTGPATEAPLDSAGSDGVGLVNYVPSVRVGNIVALNAARRPFAEYLNRMHKRFHPLFADSFLFSLDHLPPSDPLNDQHLATELEIVLDEHSGRVARLGVTTPSGNDTFDAGVLQAVRRAAPFGAPPPEIVSPDGKVYVHWVFHRNEQTCSTFNARPFLLRPDPGSAVVERPVENVGTQK
jgi:TonB family protein